MSKVVTVLSLLILLLLFATPAAAQNAEPPPPGWTQSLTGKLSATQAGFNNWAEGGVSSLALSTGLEGKAKKTSGAWSQAYEFRAGYGFIQQDTLETRKAEDLIVLKAVYQYAGKKFFSRFQPTIAISARSQFYEGFKYDVNPLEGQTALPAKVSDALSPATITESIGLSYSPNAWLTQRFGVSGKQTIVSIERLRPLYAVDPDKSMRNEIGLEAVTEVDRELFENIHYTSTLGLFASFDSPDTPDVLWENMIAMKVNSWLTVNFEWVLLLDKDRSTDIQAKEVLSVGVVYKFL